MTGVRAEDIGACDLTVFWYLLTSQGHIRIRLFEGPSQGAFGTISGDENGALRVLEVVIDMLHNPSAFYHSRCRYDDAGLVVAHDGFALAHIFHFRQEREIEQAIMLFQKALGIGIQIVGVFGIDGGAFNGQGAIYKYPDMVEPPLQV